MTWQLRSAARDVMVAEARAARPAECCGVLLGKPGLLAAAWRARNLATDPHRFLVDPQDHIAARREARRLGLEVVGFYHSHPHGAAQPSARDLAEASYPGHLYAIVGLIDETIDLRVFQENDGNFLEVPVVPVP